MKGLLRIAWSIACAVAFNQSAVSQSAFADGPPSRAVNRAVDFSRDVIPVLTRFGCNSGACHGASAGRGYLKLSLFGSRPRSDFEAIAHSAAGRILDVDTPERSLLLQKPSGLLEHGGEQRFNTDSHDYRLLREWITSLQERAPSNRKRFESVESIRCSTANVIELTIGETTEVAFEATFKTGDIETSQAVAQPNLLVIEGAAPSGGEESPVTYDVKPTAILLTAHTRGYWPITIRYAAAATTLQVFVRDDNDSATHAQRRAAVTGGKHQNPIDSAVLAAADRIGAVPSIAGSPRQLARRLWVDLLGQHPTRQQWKEAERRIRTGDLATLVDGMLSDERFALRASSEIAGWTGFAGSREALESDIAGFITQRDDLRALAAQVLIVDGSSSERIDTFHLLARDARARSELVASTWLGTRIGCAQCHDHPLDRWTQDDYFGLAACWAELEIAGGRPVRIPGKKTTDLRFGRPAQPKLISGQQLDPEQPADLQLTKWVVASDNDLFANNLSNRIWHWLMGSGIVEDVDDFRATNPPINPELLETLRRILRENSFSMKAVVRVIVLSDAYACRTSDEGSILENRLALRRTAKPIEIPIYELIQPVFGITADTEISATPGETMMMVATDGCTREGECADPFGESIALVKDQRLNRQIHDGILRLRDDHQGAPTEQVVSVLHERFFGMPITDEKLRQLSTVVGERELQMPVSDHRLLEGRVLEDIAWQWAVSREFRLLH